MGLPLILLSGMGADERVFARQRVSRPATRTYLRQVGESDDSFLSWAAWAVLTWEENPQPLRIRVWQIHGERDRLLPARCTRPDIVVSGAGHVLSMTHPEEMNRFLKERMTAHGRGSIGAGLRV